MIVRNENCLVQVGGGYVHIQEYYDTYSLKQNVAIFRQCKAQNTSFLDTLCAILVKNQVPAETIQKYKDEDPAMWETINTLFMRLSDFANEKRKAEVVKKQGKKGKKNN